jgi:hypothetical protein
VLTGGERRDAFELFARYSHRLALGTFDVALLASAKLSGATRLLSFDRTLQALAAAEGLHVFPPLDAESKRWLTQLKTRRNRRSD